MDEATFRNIATNMPEYYMQFIYYDRNTHNPIISSTPKILNSNELTKEDFMTMAMDLWHGYEQYKKL